MMRIKTFRNWCIVNEAVCLVLVHGTLNPFRFCHLLGRFDAWMFWWEMFWIKNFARPQILCLISGVSFSRSRSFQSLKTMQFIGQKPKNGTCDHTHRACIIRTAQKTVVHLYLASCTSKNYKLNCSFWLNLDSPRRFFLEKENKPVGNNSQIISTHCD